MILERLQIFLRWKITVKLRVTTPLLGFHKSHNFLTWDFRFGLDPNLFFMISANDPQGRKPRLYGTYCYNGSPLPSILYRK